MSNLSIKDYRYTYCSKQVLSKSLFITFSPYQLHVSETHSSVSLFSGWDTSVFDRISHIPVKTSNDFYTLGDIIANDQNLHGEHVNIQAVVKSVSMYVCIDEHFEHFYTASVTRVYSD